MEEFKTEFLVDLHDLSKANEFCIDINENIDSDVDIYRDNVCYDAKSMLAIINMASKPIKVKIHSDNEDELEAFAFICERYEVQE